MMQAHIAALTTKFSEHRIDYTVLNTAEPLDRALFSYLSSRERLMRVRGDQPVDVAVSLTPCSSLGLGAIAIPVLIHLIQRERKRVVEFPSLMFVRRIPYQSVRRRRIRHWALLLMRAAAIALHRRGVRAAVLAPERGRRGRPRRRARGRDPARSVGQHGLRRPLADARSDAARRDRRAAWAPTTRPRSCCSSRNAEENMRATLGSRRGSRARSTRPRSDRTRRATARR